MMNAVNFGLNNVTQQDVTALQTKVANGEALTAEEEGALLQIGGTDNLDAITLTGNNNVPETENVANVENAENAENITNTETVNATANVTGTQENIAAIEAQIKELNSKIAENNKTIEKTQEKVKELTEEIKAEVAAALKEQEKITKEQQEEIEQIVAEELAKYENSNGEMTREEFQANVSKAISSSTSEGTRALNTVVSKILKANSKLNVVDGLMLNIKTLMTENDTLTNQVKQLEESKKAAQAAQAASTASRSCDPISFNLNGAQYDFIVDDGNFDSASDFLGAENYFEAMQELDTNNDGKVNKTELEAGNIKMVKTEGSTQTVVDIASVFDNDDFVDLTSYQDTIAVDAAKTQIDNGAEQVTLGTFGLVVGSNNETIDGVSTLDSVDYLNKTYGFNDITKAAGNNQFAKFLTEYGGVIEELRGEIEKAAAEVGISKNQLQSFANISNSEANAESAEIFAEFKEQAAAEQLAEEQAAEEQALAQEEMKQAEEKAQEQAEAEAKAIEEAEKEEKEKLEEMKNA